LFGAAASTIHAGSIWRWPGGVLRKLEGISLTAVLAMSAALAGCDGPATRVCVNASGVRVLDDACVGAAANTTSRGSRWRYYGGSVGAPAVGEAAAGGSDVADSGGSYHSAPDEGISRGGFGSSGGDEGGSHGGDEGGGHGGDAGGGHGGGGE
jgi:hypothetical protein